MRCLLIVDDEAVNLYVARLFLAGSGLLVDTAEDGLQAIRRAQETAYTLILTANVVEWPPAKADNSEALKPLKIFPARPIDS